MLPSDLVLARVRGKKVHPRYVNVADPDIREMAARLIETFDAHVGRRRADLDDELREVLGTDTDFQLHKALAKLLSDRCTFEQKAPAKPEDLRRAVFGAAARAWTADDAEHLFHFDREAVLAAACATLKERATDTSTDDGHEAESADPDAVDPESIDPEAIDLEAIDPESVDQGLYADLDEEKILVDWTRCTPEQLLHRYNLALAQGVLYKAVEMEIDLGPASPQRHRALFRKVKFFQLMHRIRRPETGDDQGWHLVLDGPASLFKSSTKYGLRMATFLPTLLHFDDWRLRATVQWGPRKRRLTFELDPSEGLRSHTRLTGQWQPEELRWLVDQLPELDPDWTVSTDGELVDLGGEGVLVPDYVFTHQPTGTRAVMEVFGFWNRGSVTSRLKLLRRHVAGHVVLAVSSQLATERDDLDPAALGAEVYVFRTHPVARKVLKILNGYL